MFAALLLLVSLQDGPVASPDPGWPQWRGARRDGWSAEQGLLRDWPDGGPKLLWKTTGLGRGWSSPILVGDRIWITGDAGDDLTIFALDLEGRIVSRAVNGRSWTGSYPGARATVTYAGGRLFHLNAHGRLACLDAKDLTERWSTEIMTRFEAGAITWAFSEGVLVDGGRVIVTPGGGKALVAALDTGDGKTVWTTPPLEKDQATYASPILFKEGARRLIASCSSQHGFGIDAADGRLLWTVPLTVPYGVNASTPVVGSGRIHFATPFFTGATWKLLDDGARVERLWATPLDTCSGSGILHDGILYGGGEKKVNHWLAVDWANGETRGSLKELTKGSAIAADGRLYCLGDDGTMALVTPLSEGFKIAGRFRLVEKKVNDAWAHPVLLGGRLYLRYHDALHCYDVKR